MPSSQVFFKVYNPTGAIATEVLHAPRLDTLAGKTICELSNGQWESGRILAGLRELLQSKYPTARIIPDTEVVSLRTDLENLELVSRLVKEKGCQAVITGMAA